MKVSDPGPLQQEQAQRQHGDDGEEVHSPATPRIVSGSEVGRWTAERLKTVYTDACSEAIGLVRNGKIEAGVIYESWNGTSIQAHIVVEGRLTAEFIAAIYDYPYRVAGVLTVICPVAVTNRQSVRLVEHMGFTASATLTDCHPEGDLVLYTLHRSRCRFLEGRYARLGSQLRSPLRLPTTPPPPPLKAKPTS